MTIAFEELAAIWVVTVEGVPHSKWPMCSFEPTENTKEVPVDPTGSDSKVLHIGSDLSLNRKARSLISSMLIATSSCGNPRICRAFQGKSPSTP
jgi:hypothetical protein